jgi:hypothetical protein
MRTRLWVAALAALTLAGSAQAQVIAMRFGQNGTPRALGAGQFTVPTNGTIQIQVFLTDSDTTYRTQGGAAGAGVGIHSSNPTVAAVLTPADVTGNAAFAFPAVIHVDDATFGGATGTPNNPGNASVQNSGLTGVALTQGTPSVASPDFLLVGTFTFHAGPTNGTTTTLSLFDWQPGSTNNRTANVTTNLDTRPEMFVDTATITVGVVPEPSTLALGGLAAAGMGVIRRRRKTAATTTAAA